MIPGPGEEYFWITSEANEVPTLCRMEVGFKKKKKEMNMRQYVKAA